MIVINSIFFFLMFAYVNDPSDSVIVKRFCTPVRPVLAAMILQRLVVLIGVPFILARLVDMKQRFDKYS